MLTTLFSPVCSPASHQSDFFKSEFCVPLPLLKSINMTLKSLQDLILSVSPASPLNFPLTLCTLTHWSLGSLAFHYSFYHRPFMYATSRLVSILHTSVPDSAPQRSLLDLPLQVAALHYTLMGKYVFLWEDLAEFITIHSGV